MKISVIMVALNEAPFIATAIRAVYPFVDRVFIQTGYDRSWNGQPVEPDGTVDRILNLPDPEGKITLMIRRVPDEALARNLLMRMDRYPLDHRLQNTVGMQATIEPFCEGADFFWIIDGDEIYDPRTIGQILRHLETRRPRVLAVRGLTYFRSWNYVVSPSDQFFQPGFLKAGLVFRENRNHDQSRLWRLVLNKYTRRIGAERFGRLLSSAMGTLQLPEEVGVFHHGAYVGDDARIQKKIELSVHNRDMLSGWFADVWQKWTPSAKNLHPIWPTLFPGVKFVPTNELPSVIREARWPNGYIEPES